MTVTATKTAGTGVATATINNNGTTYVAIVGESGIALSTSINPSAAYSSVKWTTSSNASITNSTSATDATLAVSGNENVTVTATWTAKTFTVTLTAGRGIDETKFDGAGSYVYGDQVTVSADVLDGYDASTIVWSGDKTAATFTMPAADVEMSASATPFTYHLVFEEENNTNDTDVADKTFTVETVTFSLSEVPTKAGYDFAGWFTAATGGTQVTQVAKGTHDDITVYAHWTAETVTITAIAGVKVELRNGSGTVTGTTNGAVTTFTGALSGAYEIWASPYVVNATGSSDLLKVGTVTVVNNNKNAVEATITYVEEDIVRDGSIDSVTYETITVGSGSITVGTDLSYPMIVSCATVKASVTLKAGYNTSEIAWVNATQVENDKSTATFTVPSGGVQVSAKADSILIESPQYKTGVYGQDYSWTLKTPTSPTGVNFTYAISGGTHAAKFSLNGTTISTSETLAVGTYTFNVLVKAYSGDTSNEDNYTGANTTVTVTVTISANTFDVPTTNTFVANDTNSDGTFDTLEATWNAVASIGGIDPTYTVIVYRGTNEVTRQTGIVGTTAIFNAEFNADIIDQAGAYTFKVIAVSSDADVNSSAASASSTAINAYTVTVTRDTTSIDSVVITNNNSTTYVAIAGEEVTVTATAKAGYTWGTWDNGENANPYTFTVSANVSLKASATADTDTVYKVEVYVQDTAGAYPATANKTISYTGTTAEPASINYADALEKAGYAAAGFTKNTAHANTVDNVAIAGDGSTVLKAYYTRNKFAVTLNKGTGIASVTGAGSYYYGATVSVSATAAAGYNASTIVWSGDKTSASFTMPASAVTMTASATETQLTWADQTFSGTYGETHVWTNFVLPTNGNANETYTYAFSNTAFSLNNNKALVVASDIGAGTYEFTVTATASTNANKMINVTVTIEKADQTITVTGATGLKYNGSAQTLVTVTGLKETPTLSYTGAYTNMAGNVTAWTAAATATNAGTYKIRVTAAETANYNAVTSAEVTVSIAAKTDAAVIITIDDDDFVYDGNVKSLDEDRISVTIGDSAVDYTINSGREGTNAGTFTLNVTINSNNYYGKTATQTWSIAAAKYTTPASLAWTLGVASWTPATRQIIGDHTVAHYLVQLLDSNNTPVAIWVGGTNKGTSTTTTSNTFDFTESIRKAGAGTYKFTVQAIAPSGQENVTSSATATSSAQYAYSINVTPGTGITSVKVDNNNSTSYVAIKGESVTVRATVKTGYAWSKWSNNATANPYTFTASANVSLTASASLDSYTITYDLAGGTVAIANPESYTVETASFTLNNPTRNGYTFAGWTGTGISGTSTSVTIAKGSTGTRSYTATWTPIVYTITYTDGNTAGNPETYTIETPTFTLNNPTKTGYTFAGWTGTGISGTSTSVTIAKGSTGTRSYTATWTAESYAITYDLAGGSLESGKTNPASYTVETESFTLNNPTMTGYTFTGWTGTGLSSATMTVTIAKGSTGNRSYTATWTANKISLAEKSATTTSGTAVSLTVDATGGTGSYQYMIRGKNPSEATITLMGNVISTTSETPAGTYKITVYAEDMISGEDATAEMTITVNAKNTGLTISATLPTFTYDGQAHSVGTGNVSVVLKDGSTTIDSSKYTFAVAASTASNGAISATNAGTYRVTITVSGNYSASADFTWTINKAKFATPTNLAWSNGTASWTGTRTIGGVTGNYQVALNGTIIETISGTSIDLTNNIKAAAGTYTFSVTIISSDTDNVESSATATSSAQYTYSVTVAAGTGITSVKIDNNNSTSYVAIKGESVTVRATVKTGYTWSKWSNNATANPYTFTASANVSLTASATALTFNVTVNQFVVYGSSSTLASSGTSVWLDAAGGNTATRGDIFPSLVGGTITVNNGSLSTSSTTHTVTGTTDAGTAIVATANTGFTFVGWFTKNIGDYTADNVGTPASESNPYAVNYANNGLVLYALFEANTYNVTVNYNGGGIIDSSNNIVETASNKTASGLIYGVHYNIDDIWGTPYRRGYSATGLGTSTTTATYLDDDKSTTGDVYNVTSTNGGDPVTLYVVWAEQAVWVDAFTSAGKVDRTFNDGINYFATMDLALAAINASITNNSSDDASVFNIYVKDSATESAATITEAAIPATEATYRIASGNTINFMEGTIFVKSSDVTFTIEGTLSINSGVTFDLSGSVGTLFNVANGGKLIMGEDTTPDDTTDSAYAGPTITGANAAGTATEMTGTGAYLINGVSGSTIEIYGTTFSWISTDSGVIRSTDGTLKVKGCTFESNTGDNITVDGATA